MQKVGGVLAIEESIIEGRVLRTFLRARVLIDVTKPFPAGCWIPWKDLPKIWIHYKYERLQNLCFNCGCLGHEQKHCKATKVMSFVDPTTPMYHQGMIAQPAKTIEALLREHRQRHGESTKNTANKFNKGKETAQDSTKDEGEEAAREKMRIAWAEMLANCSYGTGTVPPTYGRKTT